MNADEADRLAREEILRPNLVDRIARALVAADERPDSGTEVSRAGTWTSNPRPAGDEHQVITVHGGSGNYRRRPCGGPESTADRPGCPWRRDATGRFPAEAFRHSAGTAYDLSVHKFACHEAGTERPATCAGFLLRGAEHNMAVRMAHIDPGTLDDGGHRLWPGYRSMAIGVDPDDPVLAGCRLSPDELGDDDDDDD